MKHKNVIRVIVCITFMVRCYSLANAQTDTAIPARTFVDGEIPVSVEGELALKTRLFVCTPVVPLKDGQKVAAKISEDQAWSNETHDMQVGAKQIAYPILAMVKGSDSAFQVIFPAIATIKTDIKAGAVVRSDNYQVEASRLIHAGEHISVLVVGESVLSLEQAQGMTGENVKPTLTCFLDASRASDRKTAIEVWRVELNYVKK